MLLGTIPIIDVTSIQGIANSQKKRLIASGAKAEQGIVKPQELPSSSDTERFISKNHFLGRAEPPLVLLHLHHVTEDVVKQHRKAREQG